MKKRLIKNSFFYYFYKRLKIFKNSFKNTHLGEYGEDIFIRRFFKDFKKGFYVDIGCYHPFKGSLTSHLYKNGWNGLNIDLSQISIDLFNISRPNDINIRGAVSNINGKTHYYENGPINQQNSLEGKNENQVEIDCYKLETLLKKYNIKKIDYLNVDVEGHDFKVISDFSFSTYQPKLISIEDNFYDLQETFNSNIYKLLIKNGYFLASKYGVSSIYIDFQYKNKIQKMMSV